ncbi:uncharacterized protein LOC134277410 [Saccostrea cucullata]|uniref:uncharacterized protein LOC134277410 n=1 Tax=Saccostrea cuccullata TaxID=36930 RepID=UPI002ED0C59B
MSHMKDICIYSPLKSNEIEDVGTDIETEIEKGINNWMNKSADSLKFSSLLEALGTAGFSFAKDEAFKTLQEGFISVVFGNESTQSKNYPVRTDIPFYSKTDDIAILEVNWTQLPDPFPLARFGNLPECVHVLGYPYSRGYEQIFDPSCPLIAKETLASSSSAAVQGCKEAFPDMDVNTIESTYKSIFSKSGKVWLHCSKSTTHGASGSPGIILSDHEEPKVYLMLQEGVPGFIYDNQFRNRMENLSFPNKFVFESGISMSKVYTLLSKPDLLHLRNEIFHLTQ